MRKINISYFVLTMSFPPVLESTDVARETQTELIISLCITSFLSCITPVMYTYGQHATKHNIDSRPFTAFFIVAEGSATSSTITTGHGGELISKKTINNGRGEKLRSRRKLTIQ
jgi:hypothetical protein